jgi:hypothetical protein
MALQEDVVLPAPHPKKNFPDEREAMGERRINRDLSRGAARNVVAGGILLDMMATARPPGKGASMSWKTPVACNCPSAIRSGAGTTYMPDRSAICASPSSACRRSYDGLHERHVRIFYAVILHLCRIRHEALRVDDGLPALAVVVAAYRDRGELRIGTL